MTDLLSPYLPSVGLAITIATFIIAVGRWANATLSDDILLRTSLWILGDAGSDRGHLILAAVFKRLAGSGISAKRVLVVVTSTIAIGLSVYIWFELSATSFGAQPIITFGILRRLTMMLTLISVPIQLIMFAVTGFLLSKLLRRISLFRALAFIIIELVLTFTLDILWNNAVLLPYWLETSGYVAGPWWASYRTFLADYYWLIVFGRPIVFTTYLFTLLWIAVVMGLLLFGLLNQGGTRVLALSSRFIKRKRIEEEPVKLLSEIAAGLAFLAVLAFGMLL